MDSQLQTAALIAAMANKSLRKTLDVQDFKGDAKLVAQALQDGQSKTAREDVQKWLTKLGVAWDGKSDIGEAILRCLKDASTIQRSEALLARHLANLRHPNMAGPQRVAESLKFVQQLEEMKRGELQSGSDSRSPGT